MKKTKMSDEGQSVSRGIVAAIRDRGIPAGSSSFAFQASA
jgi:hypothetical protein